MKPDFQRLMQFYPRTIMREHLFAELGWSDLTPNKAFLDTCAIRMNLPGARMRAHAGKLKNKWVEPGQAKLSVILTRIWGAPEVYGNEAAARAGIGKRTGVVSFYRISGGDGGHIDLVWTAPGSTFQDCARSCYFSAVTVWFWPLA